MHMSKENIRQDDNVAVPILFHKFPLRLLCRVSVQWNTVNVTTTGPWKQGHFNRVYSTIQGLCKMHEKYNLL